MKVRFKLLISILMKGEKIMYNFTLYMTTDCNFKCQYCYEDYHNHYQLNDKTLVEVFGIHNELWGKKEKYFLTF